MLRDHHLVNESRLGWRIEQVIKDINMPQGLTLYVE
jgi:hypothetical protein